MKSEKNFSIFLPRRHKDTKFHEELPHSCFSDFIMSGKVDKVKIKKTNFAEKPGFCGSQIKKT